MDLSMLQDAQRDLKVFQAAPQRFVSVENLTHDDSMSFARQAPAPGLLFVDGGNQLVLEMPSYSIHLLRVASVKALPQQRLISARREWLVMDRNGFVSVDGDSYECSIDELRKRFEHDWARAHVADMPSQSLIVLDGSLDRMPELPGLCVGLSKTTDIKDAEGRSVLDFLPDDCGLGCFKIGSIKGADVYMVRLHEQSHIWFRCDVEQAAGLDVRRVFGQLATLANDPVFLGYPYPLIKADALARVTNEETQMRKARMLSAVPRLERLSRQMDTHDILDTLRF